jgi:hypothetical protein
MAHHDLRDPALMAHQIQDIQNTSNLFALVLDESLCLHFADRLVMVSI